MIFSWFKKSLYVIQWQYLEVEALEFCCFDVFTWLIFWNYAKFCIFRVTCTNIDFEHCTESLLNYVQFKGRIPDLYVLV